MNIYCDESCHLERDGHPIMVLGALVCPFGRTREVARRIRALKEQNGLPPTFEVKWSRVSRLRAGLYQDLVEEFFADPDLRLYAMIADKTDLRHQEYKRTHDDWYYKLYYKLLVRALQPGQKNRIYLDIKDTRSAERIAGLRWQLETEARKITDTEVPVSQTVPSKEVEQIQLVDLLIGAIGYANRECSGNATKMELVNRMRENSGSLLTGPTLPQETKVSIIVWPTVETLDGR